MSIKIGIAAGIKIASFAVKFVYFWQFNLL